MKKRHFGYETSGAINDHLLLEHAGKSRGRLTEAESALWNYLRANQLGHRFRRRHPVLGYIPDFICLPLKLIVEIDGDYHLQGRQPIRDAGRTVLLESKGYRVLRFKNEEIIGNTTTVVEKIKKEMTKQGDKIQKEAITGSSPLGRSGEVSGGLIIFSAPSGSGKSTLVQWLMREHPELRLAFSISCTSRAPRGAERNGVEYFFLTPGEFCRKIQNDEFLEYEEVYEDRFYGTLKSQVEEQTRRGENVVFDVDVKGGCNLKRYYGRRALSIFVQAPSIEELEKRLRARNTDTDEAIKSRLAKASYEMTFAPKFDHVVVNDDLEKAKEETYRVVRDFLNTPPTLPKGGRT